MERRPTCEDALAVASEVADQLWCENQRLKKRLEQAERDLSLYRERDRLKAQLKKE